MQPSFDWDDFARALRSQGAALIDAGRPPDCFYGCLIWWQRRERQVVLDDAVPQLRRLIHEHIQSNPHIMTGPTTNTDDADAVVQAYLQDNALRSKTLAEHLERIRSDAYAGEWELQAAASILNVQITVTMLSAAGDPRVMGSYGTMGPVYHLAYLDHHFKVLIKAWPQFESCA